MWNKGKKGQSIAWPSTARPEAKYENGAKHETVCGGRAEARKQWSCVPHWQVSLRVKTR